MSTRANIMVQTVPLNSQIGVLEQTNGYKTSVKYVPVTTQNIVSQLISLGFEQTSFQKARVNRREREGYQKHTLRFSHPQLKFLSIGDSRPEIIVTNSYDKSSSVHFQLGVFRLVCTNGMVVGKSIESYRIKHSGYNVWAQIELAIQSLIESVELLDSKVRKMTQTIPDLADLLPQAAKLLSQDQVNLSDLVTIRRDQDAGSDLWSVFNRIQESLIRGGVAYNTKDKHGKDVTRLTRPIRAIVKQVEVNRKLWDIAEQYIA